MSIEAQILERYRQLSLNDLRRYTKPLNPNPLLNPPAKARRLTAAVEDTSFGDSGKGAVAAALNDWLSYYGNFYSLRWNGGSNAGHETYVDDQLVVTHQIPMGALHQKGTGIVGRGMVLHVGDFLTEYSQLAAALGQDQLPGGLLIDWRVPLITDVMRAGEFIRNSANSGGRGSTNRGIADGYVSHYDRTELTLRHLLDDQTWERDFRAHYRDHHDRVPVALGDLKDIEVAVLADRPKVTRKVGTEGEFIDRMADQRWLIRRAAGMDDEVYYLLADIVNDQSIPLTFEGAQGPGLDPYHGVYPDVTASRPLSRLINDSTYNLILPEEIAMRVAVMKTTYMSSVGTRVLPETPEAAAKQHWKQAAMQEKGKTSERWRTPNTLSPPMMDYYKRAAGYDYLAATHLDAARADDSVLLITHYTNKQTGLPAPYLPYQDALDKLEPHYVELPGWDGQAAAEAKSFEDLPIEAQRCTALVSDMLGAPVVIGKNGPKTDQVMFRLARQAA